MTTDEPDKLVALSIEYGEWMDAQGVKLGSADEHLSDESLTQQQRDWIADFCRRWEEAERNEFRRK